MRPDGGEAAARKDDIYRLQEYADSLRTTFEEMAAQAPAIQQEAKRVQMTEKSSDGLISVTVGPRGELIRLDIDPRVYRRPDTRALADSIVDTVHAATAKAQDKVMELFSPIVPRQQMQMYLDGDNDAIAEDMTQKMVGRG